MPKKKMKKYEVKLYYSGYLIKEIRAASEDDALEEAKEQMAGRDFDDFNDDERESFLNTLEHWEEADEVKEVEPGAPIDEDRVTFGPLTLPGGADVMVSESDTFIDNMIEREG